MKFYGREEELKALKKEAELSEKQGRFAVLTGRRRVGKTALLLEACRNSGRPYLYFYVKRRYEEAELAESWMRSVRQLFGLSEDDGPAKPKLAAVIRYVMKLSAGKPLTMVIDECQEIDFISPAFWSELQEVWDLGKDSCRMLLAMSGSVAAALRHIFCDASEPLFGRADLILKIPPFAPSLIRKIFSDYRPDGTPDDLLTFFALTGGVARYAEMLTEGCELSRVSMLGYVFSPSGSGYCSDGNIVLANEFRVESSLYFKLLREIASGKNSWGDLQNAAGGRQIAPYLERLEKLYGMVRRIQPMFSDSRKGIRYAIQDPYLRFWFRYVDVAQAGDFLESGEWTLLRSYCMASFDQFLGRTLEDWFRRSYMESGRWMRVGPWWDRSGGNEIDLIACNPLGGTLEICEIKRNASKISIPVLQEKAGAFMRANGKQLRGYRDPVLRGLSLDDMFS